MSVTLNYEASDAEKLLMQDCFSKLCTVPFPVEAARASSVMHYEQGSTEPTLTFLVNAYIHAKRVTPPNTLRINGIATKKYTIVPCTGFDEQTVTETVEYLNNVGYYAYTAVVNGNVKLYVCWDEVCISNVVPDEPPEI